MDHPHLHLLKKCSEALKHISTKISNITPIAIMMKNDNDNDNGNDSDSDSDK